MMPNTIAAVLLACALALVGWSARHRPPRYGTRMHPQRVPPWVGQVPTRRRPTNSVDVGSQLVDALATPAVRIMQVGPTVVARRVCGCAERDAQFHAFTAVFVQKHYPGVMLYCGDRMVAGGSYALEVGGVGEEGE